MILSLPLTDKITVILVLIDHDAGKKLEDVNKQQCLQKCIWNLIKRAQRGGWGSKWRGTWNSDDKRYSLYPCGHTKYEYCKNKGQCCWWGALYSDLIEIWKVFFEPKGNFKI